MQEGSMGKNIVVCSDGTGNQYGKNNTNVVKAFEVLIKHDDQLVCYEPGVGTFSEKPFIFAPLRWFGRLLGSALGIGLQKNVEDGYAYLMDVYEEGDRIFLFGFSRGAHTVRRLASMLDKCGLLQRGSHNMIPYASRMYLNKKVEQAYLNDNPSKTVIDGFKETYCRPCPVYFIGVWDTVAALSKLRPRPRLDGKLHKGIRYAYHAVAVDERRLKFPPNLWVEKNIDPNKQTVEQVWFAGVHSDVGGWYDERGLSNIALSWMLKHAVNRGLRVRDGFIENLKSDYKDKQHESWSGWWRLLPYVRRNIPEGAKVHESVKKRMASKTLPHNEPYKPQKLARIEDTVQWVSDPILRKAGGEKKRGPQKRPKIRHLTMTPVTSAPIKARQTARKERVVRTTARRLPA
jgi:uncharacterized protein (DUF2235 family)